MARGVLRGTSIVWRFALTSLLVFALIGVGIAALRARDVRSRSEDAAAVRAELIAEGIVAPLLTPEDLAEPVRGARYRELDGEIRGFAMEDAGVERVKIWREDGTVLFSNDPHQVGERPEVEDDLEEAFEGEVESEISDLDKPENASERRLGADRLFETYVPVSLSGDPEVDGVDAVIEVYQDYSLIQQEIDRLNDTLTVSLGVGLVALYVLLLPLMVGTTRTLRRQNAQLQAQAAQLAELLEREQETVAELRELDRMKSDFVAAASHELRTPLTTIRGFAGLLKQQDLDERSRDAVETIERQSAHLQRLVANLLREAQLEQGDPMQDDESPASIEAMLEDVRRGFLGAADRIRIRVDGPFPPVPINRIVVEEIVANLIDNALKFSGDQAPVTVEAANEDGALVIRVRDEGEGIAVGDLPRIFDRFTQLDQSSTRAHGGVGLGLHLVRELTRRSGGDVKVESVVGRGSVFTVSIPVEPAAARAADDRRELSPA